MLKTAEAAKILRKGKNYIYAAINCGELRAIKLGKTLRIRQVDLDEFIERNTKVTTQGH